jgi:amino acid permease
MIDQILKFLCILSGVTFLFKRLPLIINKLMNKNMLYLLLGCFILYILYSLYKKWKEKKNNTEKSPISFEEHSNYIEEKIKERFYSFEEKIIERFESFEEKIKERFESFEERIINILQENRLKGKKKN